MRRGFKTAAEKAGPAARTLLRVGRNAPLDPWLYAERKGILVLNFHEMNLSPSAVQQLIEYDYESWSAMTIREDDVDAIVVNPRHARTRKCTNLMHEIAHVELGHIPSRVEVSRLTGLLLVSDYSDEQEEEADWLAAAMLLPRDALVLHRRRGESVTQIAEHFGLSEKLVMWRIRITGVDVQMRRAQAFR